jgi:replicative DNA helicase
MRMEQYWKDNQKVGIFGIKYLDDKLSCILQSDLILIGARSGAGKSTLAEMIAINNAQAGYPTYLFSLENYQGDSFATRTYNYYRSFSGDFKLKQRQFACGDFKVDEYALAQAEARAERDFKDVAIQGRDSGYTIKRLCSDIIEASKNYRVIILDHLDYIDKDEQTDENTHITELMKAIREVQEKYRVAVIAISHLRKSMGKQPPAVPSVDEFIGSSNKVKQATAVIMVAPDDYLNEREFNENKKFTYFCIRKLRMGGVDNKVGRLVFDKRINAYEDEYQECIVNFAGDKVEVIV